MARGKGQVRVNQSDRTRRFVEEGVVTGKGADITVSELMTSYYEFCEDRGWYLMSTSEVSTQLPRHMLEVHKAARRNDISRGEKKSIRGHKRVWLAFNMGGAQQ